MLTFQKKISRKQYQSVIEHGIIILCFVFGANFFVFLKVLGIENPSEVIDIRLSQPLAVPLRVSVGGAIIGTLILLYETYIHPKVTKDFSLLFKRVIWQIDVALIIVIPIFFVFTLFELFVNNNALPVAAKTAFTFLSTGLFLSFFVYFYSLSILVSFLRRLRQSFGQHVFYNYLMGKYAEPIEEKRTFMFLDLNDSTHIAEALGHVKYSRFLNRCFDDIIHAVRNYNCDIYQFVGDEVVFTWPVTKNDRGKAIEMFHTIKRQLALFDNIYQTKFGVRPIFKASVSTGNVTATLVGGKAKNIAYHGDVLNTTSRLLGLCRKYQRDLLFTHFYLKSLDKAPFFEPEHIATLKLRGKANESKIYAVKE